MKANQNIRTLSELVAKSVKEHTIDKDYVSLLEMCKNAGISSYTLNLLIDTAILSMRRDSFLREINTTESFGWQIPNNVVSKQETLNIDNSICVERVKYAWSNRTKYLVASLVIIILLLISFVIFLLNDPVVSYYVKLLLRKI